MKYRQLGDTGIKVSEVGMGCGGLGADKLKDRAHALEWAFDRGVTFFDTADSYANGESERTLGRVFEKKRDRIVLATKFGTVIEPDGKGSHKDVSLGHMREAIDGSLARLRTDYVDVYQFHNPPMSVVEDGALFDALDRLVKEGKIRCYGLSIDNGKDAVRFLDATRGRTIQMFFNLFHQGAREPFLDDAKKRGAGVIVKVPLAGGALSGRFSMDYPPPEDSRRRRWGEENFAERLALVEKVRPILESGGRSMAQGALAWLLSLDAISVVIPGVSSLEKVKDNVGAGGMRLSVDELRALDELDNGALPAMRQRW